MILDLRLGQTLQHRKPEMEERFSKIGRSIFCIGAQIREGFFTIYSPGLCIRVPLPSKAALTP